MTLITAAASYPLCLPSTKQVIQELEDIFTECEPIYTDHLSQNQLIPWKEELLEARDSNTQLRLLFKLVHSIGIDALTNQTLSDPVIDGEWVYERSTHKHCREVYEGRSPLDRKMMLEDPPSHVFITKILEWVRAIPWTRMIQAETGLFAETREIVLAPSIQQYRVFYQKMALCAVQRRESQQIAAQRELALKTALVRVDQCIARMREQTEVILAEEELNRIALREEVSNRIANLQHMYQGHIAQLQNQIATAEQIHLREIASLQNQMAAHDQAEHATLAMIQAEIARTEIAHRAARDAMQQQIAVIQTTCQNEVRRLEEANAYSEARSQRQIDVLQTSKTDLQTSLRSAQTQVGHLQGEIASAHARNQEHQNNLASKQTQIESLQRQIEELREDMDDEPFFKLGPLKLF